MCLYVRMQEFDSGIGVSIPNSQRSRELKLIGCLLYKVNVKMLYLANYAV